MRHSIRRGSDQEHPKRQAGEVLLMFDASIHGHECVVLTMHATKKIPILDARPTTSGYRVDLMAQKAPGKVKWELLVKKDAH
jgi:hypothetical protein